MRVPSAIIKNEQQSKLVMEIKICQHKFADLHVNILGQPGEKGVCPADLGISSCRAIL